MLRPRHLALLVAFASCNPDEPAPEKLPLPADSVAPDLAPPSRPPPPPPARLESSRSSRPLR